jgi:outer membrane receptor protein involved in Fe transport
VAFTNAAKFNFASTSFLQAQDDRTIIGANGHYQVKDWSEFYGSFQMLHDSNFSQIGPDPIVGSGSATPPFLTVNLPCSALGTAPSPDPSLKGLSQQQLLGCTSATGMTPTITVPGIRQAVTNPRVEDAETYHYRAVAGLRGDISSAWSYDASASVNILNQSFTYLNYPTATAYGTALADQTFDIYAFNPGLQAQQEKGLAAIAVDAPVSYDYDVIASINGDLGSYGVVSPWAKNGVASVFGYEYRRSSVSDSPDSLLVTGQLIGGPTVHVFSGSEATDEGFGELRVPIIEQKPFVEALNLNLALRHGETTVTNTGNSFSANTWKADVDYAPDTQIRFRGGYNRADRAPGVYELFRPVALTGLGGGNDPCAIGSASVAACSNPALPAAAQVPASAYGNITNCNALQCNLAVGGNTGLKPEVANTWTWGVNLTPEFVPGLNASVDYWDIKIDKYIGSLNAGSILQGCYTSQPGYCQYIHRDGSGFSNGINYGAPGSTTQYSLDGSSAGGIEDFNTNLANLHTNGIDFDISYRRNIADLVPSLGEFGAISAQFLGTYTMMNSTQNNNAVLAYNCVGYYGASCGTPQAVWRHTMRVTWSSPWNADISLNWRHIGSTLLDSNASPSHNFPDYALGPNGIGYDSFDAKIPAYDYFDLAATYRLWEKYTLRLGCNNLMDKAPPVIAAEATGGTATFVGQTINGFSQYDSLGRTLFINVNAKF